MLHLGVYCWRHKPSIESSQAEPQEMTSQIFVYLISIFTAEISELNNFLDNFNPTE